MGGNRWPFLYRTGLNPRSKWTVKLIHMLTQILRGRVTFFCSLKLKHLQLGIKRKLKEQTQHTAIIKEAQPNKIYTEHFLYLNTDVHIFVTCHALFSEEVDRSLCISPINLPLFHEICKNS